MDEYFYSNIRSIRFTPNRYEAFDPVHVLWHGSGSGHNITVTLLGN